MGEIGGNDYYNALMDGRSVEEIQTFVPTVVNGIVLAINVKYLIIYQFLLQNYTYIYIARLSMLQELIEVGAVTVVVPGYPAVGCIPGYLEMFRQSSDSTKYDSFGCIKSLNELSNYHNKLLQIQLSQLRQNHPRANIIYADYYNAMIQFYRSPNKFGIYFSFFFIKTCLKKYTHIINKMCCVLFLQGLEIQVFLKRAVEMEARTIITQM